LVTAYFNRFQLIQEEQGLIYLWNASPMKILHILGHEVLGLRRGANIQTTDFYSTSPLILKEDGSQMPRATVPLSLTQAASILGQMETSAPATLQRGLSCSSTGSHPLETSRMLEASAEG
jgi:hypothetical protein